VKALEAEIKRLRSSSKSSEEDSKERDAAIESIKNRGDNWQGRGEPDRNALPREVVEAFDRQEDEDFVGATDDDAFDLQVETGDKGAGSTEKAE
jgi:hypothetical protein